MADEMSLSGMPADGGRSSATRSSLDRVTTAAAGRGLKVRQQRSNEAMIACPLHDDSTPSLHVTWIGSTGGGKVLLRCMSCEGHYRDLVAGLGLEPSDLFDEPLSSDDLQVRRSKSPAQRRAAKRRGRLGRLPEPIVRIPPARDLDHEWVEIERYKYATTGGEVVQEVIREECHCTGQRHKNFRQVFISTNGREVKRKPGGFTPVLYRAPEVAQARSEGRPIWLLEGEKDVHTAEQLGLVATTNTQGGTSFPDELVDELAGCAVFVVLDRDSTGWRRGVDLHTKLAGVDANVQLLLPAVDEAKADFTDHVEAGGTAETLVPVTVAEVTAWASLGATDPKVKMLGTALAEIEAHLDLVEAGTDVDEHRRLAKRWCAEAEIRLETLQDACRRVTVDALQAGTGWAGEATLLAEQRERVAIDDVRLAFDRAGVAVPEQLRRHLATATTAVVDETTAAAPARDVDSGWFDDTTISSTSPSFRIVGGQIVQIVAKSTRSRDDDEGEDDGYRVLLSTVVRLTAREYLETEEDEDDDEDELLGRAPQQRAKIIAPRKLAAVRVAYKDPASDELMEMRVSADAWRDHSWLESLPGPVDYDHKRAGLDTLQRAIIAVSETCVDTVIHRSTGWRQKADGTWWFVHRRGEIGATGHEPGETSFEGSIDRYDLPDPTTDAETLRDAFFEHSHTMLERLPERVTAPLLGASFRAALGHNPWVLVLVGPPGSYKTSVAAKVMHHWGERWSHSKAASSMSGNGDTFNVLRYKLHHAKDTVMWLDDFAPTKSWLEAQRHLEETARLVHNQEARGRLQREGLGVNPGTPPRASALCTSEVMPRPGSGAERMLVVPIAAKDVELDVLIDIDRPESRHGRATLGASYIQWLAGNLTDLRRHYRELEETYAKKLVDEHDEQVRQAAALASTWAGWVAMSDFLLEREAITAAEREMLLGRVDSALQAAGKAAVDPDMPRRTGARVRELLAYALGQSIAYVDDIRTGDCPPWPLARRLGWRRTILDTDAYGLPAKVRHDRGNLSLGYVLHDPGPRDTRGAVLVCDSTQLEAVLKAASATQTEQLSIDRNTAMRALYDEGVLIASEEGGKLRFTVKTRIHCDERDERRVVLRLDKILNLDDGEGPDDGDTTTMLPQSPGDGGTDVGGGGQGETPGPQNVDAPAAQSVASDEQPTAAEIEEARVADPIDLADRDGVVGWTQPGRRAVAACIICDNPASVWMDDQPIHAGCWMGSTAAQRRGDTAPAAASAQQAPTPAPARTATPAAAAPVDQPEPSQSTSTSSPAGRFQAAAAVVTDGTIWLSDGSQRPLPRMPKDLADLYALAQHLKLGFTLPGRGGKTESGQLWIGADVAEAIGVPMAEFLQRVQPANGEVPDAQDAIKELTTDAPIIAEALAAGLSIGGDHKSMRGWTRVWRGQEKSAFVVLLPVIERDRTKVAFLDDNPEPATLARRIGLYAEALQFPFQMSGSTTGLNLMKRARKSSDVEKFFQVRDFPTPAGWNLEADPAWSRKPTAEEAEHTHVVAFDRNGSYLAGVAGLELGYGQFEHHASGVAFDKKLPGYWKIVVPELPDWRMPNPLDVRGKLAGKEGWVTTPSLDFAVDKLEVDPEILEAFVWPDHARILDPWYEKIRDARTTLNVDDVDAQAARAALKSTYAAAWGMLGSHEYAKGRDSYAPDWHHHIRAKARTNLLRKVHAIGVKTGRWPVAIATDAIVYTATTQDPVEAWPGEQSDLGTGLGKYKAAGVLPIAEHLPHLTGGSYRGLSEFSDD